MIKILAISDVETGIIYSAYAAQRFAQTDLIISCGDLPMNYLDFAASTLNIPLYYVVGNHQHGVMQRQQPSAPLYSGGYNLHTVCKRYDKRILLAGVEGCLRYNRAPRQYTQSEMWMNVFSMVPNLFWNRMAYGRFLDIFVTHAPPWKIHDQEDLPHTGIRAFRWLDKVFKPKLHLHGHVHVYRSDTVTETVYYQTRVLNCYRYREINFPESENEVENENCNEL